MNRIKYPKFGLFFLMIIFTYILFQGKIYPPLNNVLISMGYFGIFVGGVLFAYCFTTPFATAFFLILAKEVNIFLAALLAGFGATIGELIMFRFIRHQFSDEIEKLSNENIISQFNSKISSVKRYFLPALAVFIISSPLPSEIGISILAASRTIPTKVFTVISYVLNTVGILAILIIGRVI